MKGSAQFFAASLTSLPCRICSDKKEKDMQVFGGTKRVSLIKLVISVAIANKIFLRLNLNASAAIAERIQNENKLSLA
jgi:hypothetical protein